ncbi:MAG TPA: hypothetical protein VIR63_04210 [Pontiella sp.]
MKLDDDSVRYYRDLAWLEWTSANFESANGWWLKLLALDANNWNALTYLSGAYNPIVGEREIAKKFEKKVVELVRSGKDFPVFLSYRIAYVFWQGKDIATARYYFDKQIKFCLKEIELNSSYFVSERHFELVCVYSFLKDYDKAFLHLKNLEGERFYRTGMLTRFKYDPLLDNIRDDPRLRAFQRQAEEKYQKEHDLVRTMLAGRELL